LALTRIHHVAAIVADADEALKFWRDALGLVVSRDEVIQDQGVRGILMPMGNCEIELIQPIRDDTGVAKYLADRGEGLHHICFESTDVASDLLDAKARGMEMIDETPRPGLAGMIGFVHPRSNHGVLIEFAQPPAGEAAGSAPASDFAPQRLHHAVCAVRDRVEAGDTLIRNFGLADGGQNRFEEVGLENWFLDLGDTQLELVTPLTDNERDPLVRRLQQGEGMFMLALSVRSVSAAVDRLRAAGVKCTDPIAEAPATYLSPKHTHGVRIALDQAV
jgi:methylmalonyl-CoA/ethylmalonyl-CoA epimerase